MAPPAARSERGRIGVWSAVTPLGRSVLVAGIGAWVVAGLTGWVELAMLATAALLALVVGVVLLLRGQADLAVRLDLTTKRVVVGDPASTEVEATNQAPRRMLPVQLEARVGKGTARMNVPALAAGASHDQLFVIPTRRRAVVPVGPVRSVQGDPLGLVRREVVWTGSEELFVHPRTTAIGPLTTGWRRDLEGETTNDRSPSDVAFHTLREYVVGDDRRHIHWRTTARQADGKLMVREFVDTRRAHVGLVLSVGAADFASGEEFELAVAALASLGVRAIGDEQDVTCLAGERMVATHHGQAFLDTMARLELGTDALGAGSIVTRGRDALAGASVGVLIIGSGTDLAEARSAAERFGPTVRPLILRACVGAEPTRRPGAGAPVLELGALADLPRLLWSVGS